MQKLGMVTRIGAVYSTFGQFFILAIPCAILLALLALLLTRRHPRLRTEAVSLSVALPFACVAYAVLAMALRIMASGSGMTTAPVNGDEEICPLRNGYVLTLSRDWQHGFVSKGLEDEPDDRFGHRYEITAIQVEGEWVLGRSELAQMKGNNYFLLSTKTGQVLEFAQSEALRVEAAKRGLSLKMESPEAYFRAVKGYGARWWMYAMLLVPVGGALAWWVRRLFRMTRPVAATASV